jgi:hypothetical protein
LPLPDATGAIALSTTDGKLALCSTPSLLTGAQPTSAAIVDFVGYGPLASWREPFAGGTTADNAPSGSAGLALFRGVCGPTDSDVNAADFVLGHPLPRSRAQPPHLGWSVRAQCQPHSARAGESVRLVAQVTDCAGVAAGAGLVCTADASALQGPSALPLLDDGVAPDELAGDGLFTTTLAAPLGTPASDVAIAVAVSGAGSTGGGIASLLIKPAGVPAHDDCARAQLLSGAFPLVANGTFQAASAEWSPVLSSSSFVDTMSSRRGVWFEVVGTGNTMTADTCASPLIGGAQIPDTVLMLLGGACSGSTKLAFNDDQAALCGAGGGVERRSRVSWCSRAGETYRLWVAPFNTGPQNFAYALTISDDGAPCSGAASAALCTPHAQPSSEHEREPALGPGLDDGCDTVRPRFRDVQASVNSASLRGHVRSVATTRDADWLRFQAGYAEVLHVELAAAFLAELELHELSAAGSCAGSTLLARVTATQRCVPVALDHALLAGRIYALRVAPTSAAAPDAIGGIAVGAASSAYRIAWRLGDPPPNDDCANALDLDCGASTMGSTHTAAPEFGSVPSTCAGPGGGTSGSYALEGPGVWYRVVLPGAPGPDDRTVYVETRNASFDTRLMVFEGACGALQCVTANDDIDASARSKVAFRAVAARQYWILVHGAGGATGQFEIETACTLTPANDECSSALPLDALGDVVAATTVGATGALSDAPLGGVGGLAPCVANGASTASYFDVWFEFVAACSARVTLDTCGAADTLVTLHGACPSPSTPSTFAGACSAQGPLGCAPGSALEVDVLAGATYLVRVAQENGAQGGAPFLLRLTVADSDGDGANDCLDGCPSDPLKVAPGVCGCGVSDVDTDGDGAADCVDGCPSDPLKIAPGICGCGVSDVDTDGDGTADCLDGCPSDPLKIAPGVCGCGVSDVDTDGDGTADCIDGCPFDPNKIAPGACGGGVSEVDSDGDGTADCVDGCPFDPNKISPGVCGCGVSDVDTDSDGTADCIDGCPLDPNKIAPGACGCGISDVDSDGDGAADCIDNCPAHPNPAQVDCDLDGQGDVCEIALGTSFDLDSDGTPDDCELGAAILYCTASTSALGCSARMTSIGVPSASAATNFLIRVRDIDGQRNGLQFYGVSGPAAIPFGAGFLCMLPPRQRTLVQNSAGTAGQCDGTLALGWNAFISGNPTALGVPLHVGQLFWIQAWWRDPASPGATALSGGLQFTLGP